MDGEAEQFEFEESLLKARSLLSRLPAAAASRAPPTKRLSTPSGDPRQPGVSVRPSAGRCSENVAAFKELSLLLASDDNGSKDKSASPSEGSAHRGGNTQIKPSLRVRSRRSSLSTRLREVSKAQTLKPTAKDEEVSEVASTPKGPAAIAGEAPKGTSKPSKRTPSPSRRTSTSPDSRRSRGVSFSPSTKQRPTPLSSPPRMPRPSSSSSSSRLSAAKQVVEANSSDQRRHRQPSPRNNSPRRPTSEQPASSRETAAPAKRDAKQNDGRRSSPPQQVDNERKRESAKPRRKSNEGQRKVSPAASENPVESPRRQRARSVVGIRSDGFPRRGRAVSMAPRSPSSLSEEETSPLRPHRDQVQLKSVPFPLLRKDSQRFRKKALNLDETGQKVDILIKWWRSVRPPSRRDLLKKDNSNGDSQNLYTTSKRQGQRSSNGEDDMKIDNKKGARWRLFSIVDSFHDQRKRSASAEYFSADGTALDRSTGSFGTEGRVRSLRSRLEREIGFLNVEGLTDGISTEAIRTYFDQLLTNGSDDEKSKAAEVVLSRSARLSAKERREGLTAGKRNSEGEEEGKGKGEGGDREHEFTVEGNKKRGLWHAVPLSSRHRSLSVSKRPTSTATQKLKGMERLTRMMRSWMKQRPSISEKGSTIDHGGTTSSDSDMSEEDEDNDEAVTTTPRSSPFSVDPSQSFFDPREIARLFIPLTMDPTKRRNAILLSLPLETAAAGEGGPPLDRVLGISQAVTFAVEESWKWIQNGVPQDWNERVTAAGISVAAVDDQQTTSQTAAKDAILENASTGMMSAFYDAFYRIWAEKDQTTPLLFPAKDMLKRARTIVRVMGTFVLAARKLSSAASREPSGEKHTPLDPKAKEDVNSRDGSLSDDYEHKLIEAQRMLLSLGSRHFAHVMNESQFHLFADALFDALKSVLGVSFWPLAPFWRSYLLFATQLLKEGFQQAHLPLELPLLKGCNGNSQWRDRLVQISGTTIRWFTPTYGSLFFAAVDAVGKGVERSKTPSERAEEQPMASPSASVSASVTVADGKEAERERSGRWTRLRLKKVGTVFLERDPHWKSRQGKYAKTTDEKDDDEVIVVVEPRKAKRALKFKARDRSTAQRVVEALEIRRQRVAFIKANRPLLLSLGYAAEVRGALNE